MCVWCSAFSLVKNLLSVINQSFKFPVLFAAFLLTKRKRDSKSGKLYSGSGHACKTDPKVHGQNNSSES